MIKGRIAFNLHSAINSPLNNPCLPSPIRRPSLLFPSPNPFHLRFRKIYIVHCSENFLNSHYEDDLSHSKLAASGGESVNATVVSQHRTGGESVNAATWVGVATLTSKILGLLREIIMASVFGVGPVAIAFKYAWILPGFSSSLLGGVNGPIHVIMASTLSKLPKDRGKKLFQQMNTIMFLIGGVVGAVVYIFPEFILHIYAPGLWILGEGRIIREIAMEQLKIMIPCIVLAGPVGLGFGYIRRK